LTIISPLEEALMRWNGEPTALNSFMPKYLQAWPGGWVADFFF